MEDYSQRSESGEKPVNPTTGSVYGEDDSTKTEDNINEKPKKKTSKLKKNIRSNFFNFSLMLTNLKVYRS